MELTISVLFTAVSLREAAARLAMMADLLDRVEACENAGLNKAETNVELAAVVEQPIEATPVEQIDLAAVFGTPMVLVDPVIAGPSIATRITQEQAAPLLADGEEIDSNGVVWTKGIHADNKAKKQDGTWKTRRGAAKKMPTNNPGRPVDEAEIKTVQDAVGKLIAFGVDIPMLKASISQAVFCDLAKTEGGLEHLLKTGDKKLAGRAMNSLRAIAVDNKTTV